MTKPKPIITNTRQKLSKRTQKTLDYLDYLDQQTQRKPLRQLWTSLGSSTKGRKYGSITKEPDLYYWTSGLRAHLLRWNSMGISIKPSDNMMKDAINTLDRLESISFDLAMKLFSKPPARSRRRLGGK